MTYSDAVREMLRLAKLRQCKEDPRGTAALQATLGAAAPVTLYAVVRTLTIDQLRELGLQTATHGLRVEIPRQTAADSPTGDSFTGGLMPGDSITHGGLTYRLQQVDRDDSDTIYTALAVRDLALQRP